ncbi:MAG: rhomboid family intramembrane serine protease [Polyangiales bacterium]
MPAREGAAAMFFLVPFGLDQSVRRLPVLTMIVMAICLLIQIWSTVVAPSQREILAAQANVQQLERRVLDRYLVVDSTAAVDPDVKPAAPGSAPSEKRILAEFRAAKLAPQTDPLFVALKDADSAAADLPKREPAHVLGYRATDGVSFRMLTCAFVHAGWYHFISNMLFLWVCGLILEDRWGPAIFGGVYASGAIAASAVYALLHSSSSTICVDACGAIAASMGAFLVCGWAVRIKMFWAWSLTLIRWTTRIFFWPAYIFGLMWFLLEVFDSIFESALYSGEPARPAYVGGFAIGVAFAGVMRVSGLDARLHQGTKPGSEWSEDPEFVRALDISEHRADEAVRLLRGVVARHPGHRDARIELLRASIAARDAAAAATVASGALGQLGELFAWAEIVAYYRAMQEALPSVALSDRALVFVVRAALKAGDARLALEATQRLLQAHPESPLLQGALWDVATVQQREGLSIVDPKALDRFAQVGA